MTENTENTEKIETIVENKESEKKEISTPLITPTNIEVDYEDIFITENSTFDISVIFQKDENKILVENVDASFDEKNIVDSKSINITFKYPSQGDITEIANSPIRSSVKGLETLSVSDFTLLETARMLCLIRKWSIKKPINNQSIMELNPKIVKAIIYKIREKIGNEGIF